MVVTGKFISLTLVSKTKYGHTEQSMVYKTIHSFFQSFLQNTLASINSKHDNHYNVLAID